MTVRYQGFFVLSIFLIFTCSIFISADRAAYEQKAKDLLYEIINSVKGECSAVFGETARTSDGTEFPCYITEVSQYGVDLAPYGPPISLSSSITFSKPEEVFSGIYVTIYILKPGSDAEIFLKKMSENWAVNSKFHGLPAVDKKISSSSSLFLIICGNFIIKEEVYNSESIRDTIYRAAVTKKICKEAKPEKTIEAIKEEEDRKETDEKSKTDDVDEKTADKTEEEQPKKDDSTAGEKPPIDKKTEPDTKKEISEPVERITPTPFENWMNHWQILATANRTRYVYRSLSTRLAPPGGGDRMIVLKPNSSKEPAMLEGRFKPESTKSMMHLRVAAANRLDAAALLVVEVNGIPIEPGRLIRGTEGWKDIEFNVGSFHQKHLTIVVKVLPDPSRRTEIDYLYIDHLMVDGKPAYNKGFRISKGDVRAEDGSEPLLIVQGLWTDLKNRSFVISQKGNDFTFSSSARIKGHLWKIDGRGRIHSAKKITVSFIEDFAPLGKKMSGGATGYYNAKKKTIDWSSKNERFSSIWFYVE